MDVQFALWLSTPNVAAAEIARNLGYGAAVLDVEHGVFDLSDLDSYVPLLSALGLEVIIKVMGPERGPIQQALDVGADVVVIPHIADLEHAREVTRFAKFPPLGDRSFGGGRTTSYRGFDDPWVCRQNTDTRCYPMIENFGAFEQMAEIAALPTVDGLFIGPSDLSLRRNRGAYQHTANDFADFKVIANAARNAGKPWMFPAWNSAEKQFAVGHKASHIVLTMEHAALMKGLQLSLDEIRKINDAELFEDNESDLR
jgi:4-hydroxy-2-oxoheptanedioate aldolase